MARSMPGGTRSGFLFNVFPFQAQEALHEAAVVVQSDRERTSEDDVGDGETSSYRKVGQKRLAWEPTWLVNWISKNKFRTAAYP